VLRESVYENAVLGKSGRVQLRQSFPADSKSYSYSKEVFGKTSEWIVIIG
jgi:hypothetical protein